MHDLLQQIMPILIFGAWIIISIYTANQKRKKKQQMQQRQYDMQQHRTNEEETHQVTEQSRTQDYSCPSATHDDISSDLKDTLESIFGTTEPQETEALPPPPYPDTAESVPLMDTTPEDQTTEAQLLKEQAALQKRIAALSHKTEVIKNSDQSATGTATEVTFSEDKLDFSSKELRKGIIWAEILGKPVSMR